MKAELDVTETGDNRELFEAAPFELGSNRVAAWKVRPCWLTQRTSNEGGEGGTSEKVQALRGSGFWLVYSQGKRR